jgi:dihydroorotate dehydrogenase (NAD+) catalytic subunit
MEDLKVKIHNLNLINPVLTASGTFGYGVEYDDFFDELIMNDAFEN